MVAKNFKLVTIYKNMGCETQGRTIDVGNLGLKMQEATKNY